MHVYNHRLTCTFLQEVLYNSVTCTLYPFHPMQAISTSVELQVLGTLLILLFTCIVLFWTTQDVHNCDPQFWGFGQRMMRRQMSFQLNNLPFNFVSWLTRMLSNIDKCFSQDMEALWARLTNTIQHNWIWIIKMWITNSQSVKCGKLTCLFFHGCKFLLASYIMIVRFQKTLVYQSSLNKTTSRTLSFLCFLQYALLSILLHGWLFGFIDQ
jgi:hypothetical protein